MGHPKESTLGNYPISKKQTIADNNMIQWR